MTQQVSDDATLGGRQGGAVLKRKVFYIPGYDPFPPRRYRELYRNEGAEQAKISGYELKVRPKSKTDSPYYGWQVQSVIDGVETQTDVSVLSWSDIVRKTMGGGVFSTYAQLLTTAWIYITTGALKQVMKTRKGPVLAALYPVMMLIMQLFLAILTARLAFKGLNFAGSSLLELQSTSLSFLLNGVFCAISLCLGFAVLLWFKHKDHAFFVYYLMHDFAHSAKLKGAYSPSLNARLSAFSGHIKDTLSQDYDEILLVGHSSGAHLGASVLAAILRDDELSRLLEQKNQTISFLTLGHVFPMVAFLPKADQLRGDLSRLSTSKQITWVDITAPGDGCAFALCDPVCVSGVAPKTGKRWPLVLSAAFTQSLSAERWKQLRWRFFRLHFQYLCAFDQPQGYDYFQITAGPQTLAERYLGRSPSKSRIETPLSGYRTMKDAAYDTAET